MLKDAQLLIRINTAERDKFIHLCEELDTSAARELRKFIRSFIKKTSRRIHPLRSSIVAKKQIKSLKQEIKARLKNLSKHEEKLTKL